MSDAARAFLPETVAGTPRHGSDFSIIKSELAVMSAQGGDLAYVGTLGEGTSPDHWSGNISLATRLRSGELTTADVDKAMAELPRHFVPVSLGAPKRCVDERSVEGFDGDDPGSYILGPQVQGATVDKAIVHRLGLLTAARTKGLPAPHKAPRLATDVVAVMQRPSKFAAGAHTGTEGDCGSVAHSASKLRAYSTKEARDIIAGKTDTLLGLGGAAVENRFYDDLGTSAQELSAVRGYFGQDPFHAVRIVRHHNPNGVVNNVGTHGGIIVSVNYVHGTTFNQSSFNEATARQTGKNIGCFNLDAWHILEEHPGDEGATLIAQAVNTLAHLTDGTLLLLVRTPGETARS